jgi:colicin import membrane protein
LTRRGRRSVGGVRAIFLAIAVHIVIIALLVVGVRWQWPKTGTDDQVVKATVVDDPQVQQEVQRLKQEEQRRRAEAEREKQREAQAKAETERQKQVEAAKAEADRRKQAEAAKEAARQVELKKQQAAAQKKRDAEKAAADAEAARKKVALAQQRERERKEAETALKEQLDAEEQERAAAEKAHAQAQAQAAAKARAASELGRYKTLIQQKVQRNWVRPPTAAQGLQCIVRVRLLPGGNVISATVIKSSGNAAFDRSVEAAVYKAAPLPVPTDGDTFDMLRETDFKFNPEE